MDYTCLTRTGCSDHNLIIMNQIHSTKLVLNVVRCCLLLCCCFRSRPARIRCRCARIRCIRCGCCSRTTRGLGGDECEALPILQDALQPHDKRLVAPCEHLQACWNLEPAAASSSSSSSSAHSSSRGQCCVYIHAQPQFFFLSSELAFRRPPPPRNPFSQSRNTYSGRVIMCIIIYFCRRMHRGLWHRRRRRVYYFALRFTLRDGRRPSFSFLRSRCMSVPI